MYKHAVKDVSDELGLFDGHWQHSIGQCDTLDQLGCWLLMCTVTLLYLLTELKL